MTVYRRTGLVQREVAHRDASLVLIATEDRYAGAQYFDALKANGVIDAQRVCVFVVPTEDCRSNPRAVLDRLGGLRINGELKAMDQRWLSIDRDRWPEKLLAEVCRECVQRGWFVAVSNPCFEAWLLLHHTSAPLPKTATDCEAELRALLGAYNKTSLRPEIYTIREVSDACARALALDPVPSDRWPQQPGSHLYRLVAPLLRAAPG